MSFLKKNMTKVVGVMTLAVVALSPVAAFAQITVPDWDASNTEAVLATAGDTIGENLPALISFFIKFGLPIILILAVWYFARRAMKGRA